MIFIFTENGTVVRDRNFWVMFFVFLLNFYQLLMLFGSLNTDKTLVFSYNALVAQKRKCSINLLVVGNWTIFVKSGYHNRIFRGPKNVNPGGKFHRLIKG